MSLTRLLTVDRDSWQSPVLSIQNSPGLPSKGDRYIVGSSPTGQFSNNAHSIAYYDGDDWFFIEPKEGWYVFILSRETFYFFNGSEWVDDTKASKSEFDSLYDSHSHQAGLLYDHIHSDGSDHSFINQDVTDTASPTFSNLLLNNRLTIGFDAINPNHTLTVAGTSLFQGSSIFEDDINLDLSDLLINEEVVIDSNRYGHFKNLTISDTSRPGDTLFTVEGSNGVLFSVKDSYEDGIVSFNDISGLPVLEIKDDVIKAHREVEVEEIKVSGTRVKSSLPEGTEIDLAEIRSHKTVIQEKRVSPVNMLNGYINLDYDPDGIASVSVAGGSNLYGSTDVVDGVTYDPDYFIDKSFTPARLVWNKTWGTPKEYPLSSVIEAGDRIIITYTTTL